METWTLFWHEPIFLIHRTWSRQPGGIKQLCEDFGVEPWFSSVCHPEAREIAKLCSNQSLHQRISLIRSSSLPESVKSTVPFDWIKSLQTARLQKG